MCWECDRPGGTRLDYLGHMCGVIAQHGWAVQGVERDRIHPPWAYTVGLTARGRPELVVTGMQLDRAAQLLNDVAAHVVHAAAPSPGEQIALDGGPVIEIVKVANPAARLMMAVDLYGHITAPVGLSAADCKAEASSPAGNWPLASRFRGGRCSCARLPRQLGRNCAYFSSARRAVMKAGPSGVPIPLMLS